MNHVEHVWLPAALTQGYFQDLQYCQNLQVPKTDWNYPLYLIYLQAGVEEFAKVFSKWPVTGIRVKQGTGVLHLKSMSSMCAVDTIAISGTSTGMPAWREIETQGRYKYKKLFFPDDNGANCLFINGVVLHPSKQDYPESFKVWQMLECEKIELPNSEMIKADGSLTCNSILIN